MVLNASAFLDHLAASEQTRHGYRSGHALWGAKVYLAGQLLRLESGPEHSAMATWMGRHDPGSRDTKAETDVDGQATVVDVHT